MRLTAGRWLALAAIAVASLAGLVRFASSPGSDLDPVVQEMMGRAPRLDAYWYTRAAVDGARGAGSQAAPEAFDRPLYTAFCRTVFAVTGTSERVLAAPSILAASLGVAVLLLVGWTGGLGRASLLAAAFAATNWIAVVHDREPLVYSTVNLVLLLSVLAWVRGARDRRWFLPAWVGIAVTVAWGKETVLLAVPALLAGHVLLAGRSARSRLRAVALTAVAAGAGIVLVWLLAPDLVAVALQKVATRASFLDLPFPSGWLAAVGDLPATLAVIGKIPAIAALATIGIVAVALEGETDELDCSLVFRRVLVLWVVIGCAVVAGFSYRPTRYVLGLFAPTFLLAAHGARVLWGAVGSPVRLAALPRTVILWLVWWMGYAALYSWIGGVVPGALRVDLPPVLWLPAVRFGVAAAFATITALVQSTALAERDRVPPTRRWAVALTVFVFLTDARGFGAHFRPTTFDDLGARRSFEAMVGPGARVQGYAAHYLAFDPRYRVAFEFDVRASTLLANAGGSTHLATLWVPELAYVEREMASAGAPLHRVADLVIGRERYRVYRMPATERLGYRLTAFENARLQEERGDIGATASAYRGVLGAGADDPIVLAVAGAAIAGSDPSEGLALLYRAAVAAPRNGVIVLLMARAGAAAGIEGGVNPALARAAALLPHELVLGFGPRPRRQLY